MHKFTRDKAVNLSFMLDDMEGWYAYAKQNNLLGKESESPIVMNQDDNPFFIGIDPEGYYMRFCKVREKD